LGQPAEAVNEAVGVGVREPVQVGVALKAAFKVSVGVGESVTDQAGFRVSVGVAESTGVKVSAAVGVSVGENVSVSVAGVQVDVIVG
jgi:hypothetical protein